MDTMIAGSARIAGMLFAEDFDFEEPDVTLAPPPEPQIIEPHFTVDRHRGRARRGLERGKAGGHRGGRSGPRRGPGARHGRRQDGADERSGEARDARREGRPWPRPRARWQPGGRAARALPRTTAKARCGPSCRRSCRGCSGSRRSRSAFIPGSRTRCARSWCRLDPELSPRVRLVPTDAVAFGDVRIDWQDGTAQRDAGSMWRTVRGILVGADLLEPASAEGELAHAG